MTCPRRWPEGDGWEGTWGAPWEGTLLFPPPCPTPPSLPPDSVLQEETRSWGGREDTQRGAQGPPRAQHGHLSHAGGLRKTMPGTQEALDKGHKPNPFPPRGTSQHQPVWSRTRGACDTYLVAALWDLGGDGHGRDYRGHSSARGPVWQEGRVPRSLGPKRNKVVLPSPRSDLIS